MNDYLDLKWTFEVPMMDVIQKVVDENKKLTQSLDKAETKVQKLRTCLADLSNKNCQEEMGNSGIRCKRKSVESCGEQHLRRIKRKRAASCVASLAWLESEDCVPLKLTVQNRQSGAIETLVLNELDCFWSRAHPGPRNGHYQYDSLCKGSFSHFWTVSS